MGMGMKTHLFVATGKGFDLGWQTQSPVDTMTVKVGKQVKKMYPSRVWIRSSGYNKWQTTRNLMERSWKWESHRRARCAVHTFLDLYENMYMCRRAPEELSITKVKTDLSTGSTLNEPIFNQMSRGGQGGSYTFEVFEQNLCPSQWLIHKLWQHRGDLSEVRL